MNKLEFIDTHVHLYDEAYDADFNEVLDRMKSAGVIKCILPAIDSTIYERQSECAAKCSGYAYEAMGVHPTSIKADYKRELEFALSKLYSQRCKFVAVGEIGLDGYWSKEFMSEQIIAFKEQVVAAAELDLPIIIHLREATEELFMALDELKGIKQRGVLHAFSGSSEIYERVSKYGDYSVGIGGVVTFKNASVAESLTRIPLERVVLETDAPWLTPAPYRGKRNESSYLAYIADKIAQIKGVDIDKVSEITTKNALSLFELTK